MEFSEYSDRQAGIARGIIRLIVNVFAPFKAPQIDDASWRELLQAAYQSVEDARYESARLGREWYDDQRSQHFPDLPRNDSYLATYDFDWFVDAMEPVRDDVQR